MKIQFTLAPLASLLTSCHSIKTQTYDRLVDLKGYSQKVFYSPGHEARAKEIATRCDNASNYFAQVLDFRPTTSLFILAPDEWSTYGTFPVYGMPHYPDFEQLPAEQGEQNRLVIAAEDNEFWQSFLPPVEQLPLPLAEKVKIAYQNKSGQLSMMPFFDLLALHELGHGFHVQAELKMQRLWMQELFANIMLHTYIAEKEPKLLPALVTFPEMVIAAGSAEYEHTSLADFERLYDNMDAKNYGWYQCRLHNAAKHIYEAGGAEVLPKLWDALKTTDADLTDEQFVALLQAKVHLSVADVLLKW